MIQMLNAFEWLCSSANVPTALMCPRLIYLMYPVLFSL